VTPRRAVPIAALVVAGLLAAAAVIGAAPSVAAPAVEQRWAVLVGINDYAGRTHDTYGGVGDVRVLRKALVDAGWPESHIIELTDAHASAASIRDALRWLSAQATPDSMSVFHYSGHVKQLGGDPDRDGEALDEHLWSSDNRFISDGELAGSLRQVQGRVWVDIAGCEAAGFDDGLSGPRHLFTASSLEHEKSYENPQWGTSVFTGLLVDRGLVRGAAPADPDGRISIQSAFAYAADQAPTITSRQSDGPQHPFLAGGDGAKWFLAAPPPPPPPPKRCIAVFCSP
jgi:hypothetical protein